jgi:hypothetical protein
LFKLELFCKKKILLLFENLIRDINARGEFCQELPSLKIE